MEEKTGVLDKFEVIAKVATNPMWEDISDKVYDGEDAILGTHHWEGCPLPMIPTVEFMDDGTYLLIVTKEGYEAYKSAHAEDVIIANCNGIKGPYDMVKNDIDVVYVVPEEFILEYNATKEERDAFVKKQRDKRWEIENEEKEEVDDEAKRKFLQTLPDDMVPDKSEEALNQIIESEELNPQDKEENESIHIRFGKNVSIIKTIDEVGFEEDYEMIQYSYDGKTIEERSHQCNEYVYESKVEKYDENEESIYIKARYEDKGNDTYDDTLSRLLSEGNHFGISYGRTFDYRSQQYKDFYKSNFFMNHNRVSALEFFKAHPELEIEIVDQMECAHNDTRGSNLPKLTEELDSIIDYINARSELKALVDEDNGLDKKLNEADELLQDYQLLTGQDAPNLDGDKNE